MNAVTLFSGAGICELFLKDIGINVIAANEVVKTRSETHNLIYPNCKMINKDITESGTQDEMVEICKNGNVDLIIATPPCQGLSTAGKNKKLEELYKDKRNFLILSALNIVDRVKPSYFIIENVPRFQKMVFPYEGELISLEKLLQIKYSDEYNVNCSLYNSADYGVPQTRFRIVYRIWKKGLKWDGPQKRSQISLEEAIGDLPSLEAGQVSDIKNHYARKHPKNHIECMKHTPTGKSAFLNMKYYPKKADGERIKGYGNSYKRMKWNVPAPTITMRNEIVSSQENVHPGRKKEDGTWSDARVLTLRELLIVSSMPPDMEIPNNITETAFRQLIGEGIPPKLMEEIMKGIL